MSLRGNYIYEEQRNTGKNDKNVMCKGEKDDNK